MPDYVTDPSDSTKQVMKPKDPKLYDRPTAPPTASLCKTPNSVLIGTTPTQPIGFFFGGSASFATKATAEGDHTFSGEGYGDLTASQHYVNFGKPAAGTSLPIHPNALSCSLADHKAGSVVFVYRGGLDGQGRS